MVDGGGLAGAMYGVSESGWMEADNFLSWFQKLFLPAVAHLTKSSSWFVSTVVGSQQQQLALGSRSQAPLWLTTSSSSQTLMD